MDRSIHSIQWKQPEDESAMDVTDAIEKGVISSTPHPDPNVDTAKGYSVHLTLKPDSGAFADALQEALMTLDPPRVTLQLDGVEDTFSNVPVGVTKVPHLGVQNEAELSVKPEAHDQFHKHF